MFINYKLLFNNILIKLQKFKFFKILILFIIKKL